MAGNGFVAQDTKSQGGTWWYEVSYAIQAVIVALFVRSTKISCFGDVTWFSVNL